MNRGKKRVNCKNKVQGLANEREQTWETIEE
jgi:hypothetical protein